MAMGMKQRPLEHGHRQHRARPETENGRVISMDAPRLKKADYRGYSMMGKRLQQMVTLPAAMSMGATHLDLAMGKKGYSK